MTTKRVRTLVLVVATVLAATLAPRAQTGHDLFQQALVKERAEGNLPAAIRIYQDVIRQAAADRALVARALVQLAGCYRKIGNLGEASKIYDRILTEFSSHAGPVAEARAGREALARPTTSRPASPPARTEPRARRLDVPASSLPSPDGVYLAFWSGDDIAVRHIATGAVRTLVADTESESPCDFAWSRDSRRLAYQWCYDRGAGLEDLTELRVINVDGSDMRVVYPKSEDAVVPLDWSPDDATLAVQFQKASDDTIHFGVLPLAGGVLRDLKNFGTDWPRIPLVSFSPDGRHLVYSRPPNLADPMMRNIVTLPVDGGEERGLVQHAFDSQFLGWTPRGGMLFTGARTGTVDVWLVDIANGQLDGVPVRVKTDVGPITAKGMTATGALYYTGTTGLGIVSDVFLVPLDPATGKVTSSPALVSQSVGHSFNPRWSTDGRQLAFKSGPRGQIWPAISILTFATGEERSVRPRPHVYMGPWFDWSPDGRAFLTPASPTTPSRPADDAALYRIDADTGEASALVPIPFEGPRPMFLPPDGRSILYRLSNQIMLRDLETGSERVVGTTGGFLRSFAPSPDGRMIAVLGARSPEDTRGDIHVTSLADGRSFPLVEYQTPVETACCSDVTWSHDSKYVIYGDRTADVFVNGTTLRQTELWRVPATGGRAEKLGLTGDSIITLSLSPDGRRLAFSREPDRSGYWVLENFLPASETRARPTGAQR